jgi:hypothetical protein
LIVSVRIHCVVAALAAWPLAQIEAAPSTPAVAEVADAAPAVDAEVLARWLADLDSADFARRSEATRRLVSAGGAAIAPLVQAAKNGSLEVKVRAVAILEEIFTAGSDADVDAAEAALVSLASSDSRSAAARADAVLAQNSDIRQRRALAEIERLGGGIEYSDPNARAFNPVDPDEGPRIIQFIRLGANWKGGEEGLKHLKRLTHAKVLQIYIIDGSGIGDEAIKDLQAALPDTIFQHRGRSFLGVRGATDPNGRGCQIITTEEGSAAEKAGLQSGDIITHFNGKRSETFEALIDLIAGTRPGEKIPVKILRNLDTMTVEVEMAGWSR